MFDSTPPASKRSRGSPISGYIFRMTIISLFGSGEFMPWAAGVDRWCVENASASNGRVLVCPTASAPEGESTFTRWANMGVEHYRSLGFSPEVLEVRTRADAERSSNAALIEDAALIFFSGGNPGYLADTLRDTPVWSAILAALANGTALGGCSAGAAAFGVKTFWVEGEGIGRWVPGLDLLDRAFVLPHFDQLDHYTPGLRRKLMKERPRGAVLLGVDENTAIYGRDGAWSVAGEGGAWVGEGQEELTAYRDGDTPLVRLGLALG